MNSHNLLVRLHIQILQIIWLLSIIHPNNTPSMNSQYFPDNPKLNLLISLEYSNEANQANWQKPVQLLYTL